MISKKAGSEGSIAMAVRAEVMVLRMAALAVPNPANGELRPMSKGCRLGSTDRLFLFVD